MKFDQTNKQNVWQDVFPFFSFLLTEWNGILNAENMQNLFFFEGWKFWKEGTQLEIIKCISAITKANKTVFCPEMGSLCQGKF